MVPSTDVFLHKEWKLREEVRRACFPTCECSLEEGNPHSKSNRLCYRPKENEKRSYPWTAGSRVLREAMRCILEVARDSKSAFRGESLTQRGREKLAK